MFEWQLYSTLKSFRPANIIRLTKTPSASHETIINWSESVDSAVRNDSSPNISLVTSYQSMTTVNTNSTVLSLLEAAANLGYNTKWLSDNRSSIFPPYNHNLDNSRVNASNVGTESAASSKKTTKKRRLLHLICPFPTEPSSSNEATQQMVLASLSVARQWLQESKYNNNLEVDIVSVGFDEQAYWDLALPAGFRRSKYPLKYSSLDLVNRSCVDSDQPNREGGVKKLPLLREIFYIGRKLAMEGGYDFLIHSNMDINVMPYFYVDLHMMLKCSRALFINRQVDKELSLLAIITMHVLMNELLCMQSRDSFGKGC